MFTRENICKSIEEIKAQPMTPERVHVLAGLLYIKRHCGEAPKEHAEDVQPLTKETAMEWVAGMENADGTTGGRWSMEKTEEARTQRGIQCDPLEFYVAMNMMYSDYVKAAEKVDCSSMDFYACMAKAFLDDKDARPDKLARYHRYIAGE